MSKQSIKLSAEQRQDLERLIKAGKVSARLIQHAHLLLKTDSSADKPGWADQQIQHAFDIG